VAQARRAANAVSPSRSIVAQSFRFGTILEGMLDPVVTIDPDGTVLEANRSCLRVFGYEPSELIGRNVSMLMPEPYRSEHDRYLAEHLRTGRSFILGQLRELPVLRKDGEQIEVELSVSRIELSGGDFLYCGSFRDITERRRVQKALAESERRFRAIFDGEYQFVGLLRPDGSILELNQAVLEKTGVCREDELGQPFWKASWWPDDLTRARVEEAVKRAAHGEFVRFELELRGRNEDRVAIDFSVKPMRDEQGSVVLLIPEGRDITELKAAQRRETAMTRAFAEIGESASLLAHEIKNPITSVNLALRAVAKQLGEDEREVLTDLVARMQKLEKLMRRTLSLTRPLSMKKVSCDPGELGPAIQRLLGPHLEEAGVRFVHEVEPDCPPFMADKDLLEDVLTNLVRNAIEALAGREQGNVRLQLARAANRLRIVLEDDGPGIPESVLKTLFRPYVTTKASGTGLGLALARKTIEAHGGSIGVENGSLGGARFEIYLPL